MKSQLVRFGSIGVLNTLIDFILFTVLTNLIGIHFVAANTISTGTALALSFFLNGKVTFRSQLTGKTGVLFLVTTLFGLWVLQPLVISVCEPFIARIIDGSSVESASLLIAKLIATIFSLTWNFFMYKYVVFKDVNPDSQR